MAFEETLRSITLNADATVGIYTGFPGTAGAAVPNGGMQYRFIKMTGAHQCGIANATDTNVVGVLQNKPQGVGHAATVGYQGISKVRAAKALAANVTVYSDANGSATDVAGTGQKAGTTVLACGAAGDLVPVLLRLNG